MKINVKKISALLKSINVSERHYLRHCIGVSDSIQDLIKTFKLTKQQVCDKFNISPRKYNDFIKGAHNYDMIEMATLNAWFMELEMEALKNKVPVKVVGES